MCGVIRKKKRKRNSAVYRTAGVIFCSLFAISLPSSAAYHQQKKPEQKFNPPTMHSSLAPSIHASRIAIITESLLETLPRLLKKSSKLGANKFKPQTKPNVKAIEADIIRLSFAKPSLPEFEKRIPKQQRSYKLNIFGAPALRLNNLPLATKIKLAFLDSKETFLHHLTMKAHWTKILYHARSMKPLAQIEYINRIVNARIGYQVDQENGKSKDRWAPAIETISKLRGDCEDIAVLKLSLLRLLGFGDGDLYTVAVKILGKSREHAVTAVRYEGEFLILDNMTNLILTENQVRGYRPLYSANRNGFWLHGRTSRKIIRRASNDADPLR